MFYIISLSLVILLIGVIDRAGLSHLDITKGWLKDIIVVSATLLVALTTYQVGWVDGNNAGRLHIYQYYNPDETLGVIDRIENEYVVIEQPKYCGDPIIIHTSLLPDYIIEGDVIMRDLSVNVGATFDRYMYNRRALDDLLE